MMDSIAGKSRREKRKEARLAKKQNHFTSWMEHQTGKRKKKKKNNASVDLKPQSKMVESNIKKKKLDSFKKEKSTTKFQEFLELEMGKGALIGEEDLEMEKRLAKKLKVNVGKLKGPDDGINFLIGGSPSEPCSMFDDGLDNDTATEDGADDNCGRILEDLSMKKKHKRKKSSDTSTSKEQYENGTPEKVDIMNADVCQKKRANKSLPIASEEKPNDSEIEDVENIDMLASEEPYTIEPAAASSAKYMPPQMRARMGIEFGELLEIRRTVKRLLNQLNDSNVEPITKEVATIFRSLSRSDGCQIIGQAFVESSTKNESFSAAFAAFVAGMACLVGIDFSAKLIASLAQSFEDEYVKANGIFLKNFAKILCNMCVFGVCSSDLIYDLLSVLSKRLTELDVSVIDTILDHCGVKIRGDDPVAMKDFIFSIQNRANEMKSLSDGTKDGKRSISRMEFMLEKICDIKNNKIRPKEVPANHTRMRKWLQKLRAEDILLRGLKWNKLLDPEKKGQWWISGEDTLNIDNAENMVTTINKEVVEAQKLVQLAAAQRMNTDIRRAIFCIIMSGEDYLDAFEKLLRLDLTGKQVFSILNPSFVLVSISSYTKFFLYINLQDREITRVLVECCLQEKVFNKYYTVLASKLCSHDKNNKFSLQYCLWDHFKELESMELNRSLNLARFAAEMLCNFSLSLAILKTVDLTDPAYLTPKRIMHFRMLFEAVFNNSDAVVWNVFTRIAAIPELEMLRSSIIFFVKQYVVPVSEEEAAKFKIAKKALNNVAGVLM
ncbi:nucleolar MIF4G domain-containing protein 1 [Canna indica]|uniref:Nucleolar MIF4G domain-containing protein 1 n=1 Tax=Canna indica TaxID=4628 RepID=A0AAQ3KU49_9LILI|nr:nucleolar MIF4G domain-containing protein 1 [Canna indica]